MRHLTPIRPVAPVRFVKTALSLLAVSVAPWSVVGPAFAGPPAPACESASRIALNDTALVDGPDASSAELFALEIPASGVLAIELNIPGFEVTETWIDLLANVCTPENALKARLMEQSLHRQLWEITTPGRYHVRVGTVDPGRALARFKLSTRWLPDSGPGAILPTKDNGVEECDEEILPLPPSCARAAAWCAPGEPADDMALCARPLGLGQVVDAELGNAWGEDHDYVVFELDRARVVRLETTGTIDTIGVLYAASGERLAVADGGGDGDNFALVAALRPGRYFVRVEGLAEGAYRLWLLESE